MFMQGKAMNSVDKNLSGEVFAPETTAAQQQNYQQDYGGAQGAAGGGYDQTGYD